MTENPHGSFHREGRKANKFVTDDAVDQRPELEALQVAWAQERRAARVSTPESQTSTDDNVR